MNQLALSINTHNLNKIVNDLSDYKNSCDLLIVTKTRSVSDIQSLSKIGYSLFGENRVQEADRKYKNLREKFNFNLHLIGPLQSNKYLTALNCSIRFKLAKKKIIDLIGVEIEKNPISELKIFIVK